MTIQDLLDKCEYAYDERDFKKLIELCDEVFKKDSDNQIAISYKAISYCFLNQSQKALEILNDAIKLYPDNYYHKNITAMVYYDLGEYEKSLECCEEGLKIKDFDWLYENKMKALIMLDRIDEAIELYESINYYYCYSIDDLLFDAGKYRQALDYYLKEDEFDLIDKLKISILKNNPEAISELGDYYLSWINKIKYKHNLKVCPECGGELIPILWGYPDNCDLEKSAKGELYLGGCSVIVPWGYHCKNCSHDLNLGYKGLEIECDDDKLYEYIKFKIREITSELKIKSRVFIKTYDTIKEELNYFDNK
ncbi:MAG: tetratricopeptide repeat protein, partial [Methanobrevibacter sp.]|nr:tetratricopeptide repeat protein [Methanobrevibacter sp.]